MYHPTLPPKYALDKKGEDAAAAEGYGERYIFQDYPRNIHHESGRTKEVKNAEEEGQYIGSEAKESGWSRKPTAQPEGPGEISVPRTAPTSKMETDNFQKIQDLEYAVETMGARVEKLADGLRLQKEVLEALLDKVEALTPKKTTNQPPSRTKDPGKPDEPEKVVG